MTDKKISELPELTTATITDLLAIVNSDTTKKITVNNFVNSPIPLDAVLFNISPPAVPTTEGYLFYDADDHTISIRTEVSDVTLQVGQELHLRVYNDTGGTLFNGKPVYISGINGGGLPEVSLAKADAVATSKVVGVITSDIDDQNAGRATIYGLVREIDTSLFGAGDSVYLSPSVAGEFVVDPPDAPNLLSLIGTVVVSDVSDGVILVNSIVNSAVLDERYGTTIAVSWPMGTPAGTSGTFYAAGFYNFGATDNNFSPSITFGTANVTYAAHFLVVLGEPTVDELTLRVTGTSITDQGVRTPADTQDIVIPNGTVIDSYFETPKKWLGQVTISVVSGTAKLCNYGWCKYWDALNQDFLLSGLEALWRGGANDASPDIEIIHHKTTGWTYNAGAEPDPPTAIASMATDHGTEKQIANGEQGAWKRDNLSEEIAGSAEEGLVIIVTTTANRALDVSSSITVSVSPA